MMDARAELAALEDSFVARHVAPNEADIATMLRAVGAATLDELAAQTVPGDIRIPAITGLPDAIGEAAVIAELRDLAGRNRLVHSLIGQGYHGTLVPPVIQRNVLENPGWYTAYTPYQAELAQGRLEALLNFQTMVCDLTGMPIANASLLDEATAAAEAVAMAHATSRAKSTTIAVCTDLHPQTAAVLATRAAPLGWTLAPFAPGDTAALGAAQPFAVVLQYPGTTGALRDLHAEIAAAHEAGALAIVCADLLSLVMLTPPGEMGADVVVGSAQRFGVPMGYGGPHAAFFATQDKFKRAMPGRLVGVSQDAAGHPALRLALQTREQHIRREKATSNICTAQVLLAVMAGMYAVWHGPAGLTRIARRVNLQARALADAAVRGGLALRHDCYFDTLALTVPDASALMARAVAAGFNLRRLDDTGVAIALDETVTAEDLAALAELLGAPVAGAPAAIPAGLLRTSPVLPQAVFGAHRSEHEMLRYLKRLEDRDVALNRSMIPLGSCTMKLNATAEMVPVTLPGFADIHPFAPADQTAGYDVLIARLSGWLAAATGFAGVSLQPNAGSQGEYAGLLAIRAYHAARGESGRDICLIPSSAHGTNPASAVMAGLRVVVVGCDKMGNVDLDDLRTKAELHADKLAALMVTYPSTHGVFEGAIRDICATIHQHGGQVYMDGANMNAQLGLTSPAAIGADVCHLNLHKTFCIPHGGGGPGVGPIGVAAHLAAAPAEPPGAGGCRPGHRLWPGQRGAVRLGADPADLLRVYPHDGRRRADPGVPGRDPERQLHGQPAARRLPGAVRRAGRPGGARVHHRLPRLRRRGRRAGRGHRQAPAGLRLPRPDHELAGDRHADDRADRERAAFRAGPVLRRHAGNPGGDRPGRRRVVGPRRQPAEKRAAHRGRSDGRHLAAAVLTPAGGVPAAVGAGGKVLAAGEAGGQRLRRPQPGVHLRAAGQLRGRCGVATRSRFCHVSFAQH